MARATANDSQFTWADFVLKTNTELLANLGNFVNRSLKVGAREHGAARRAAAGRLTVWAFSRHACVRRHAAQFLKSKFAGVLPEMQLTDAEQALIADVGKDLKEYIEAMDAVKVRCPPGVMHWAWARC